MSEMRRDNSNKKIRTVVLVITLIMLGILAWFVIRAGDKAENDKKFTFESNSERVSFLNTLGLIVEPDPETERITIPAQFSESYNDYNELQKSQGFDLMPYAGKEAVLYTYNVLNYPDYPENVKANLIFDDHRLIAADITYEDAENGFTLPLIDNVNSYEIQPSETASDTVTSAETTAPVTETSEIPETTTAVPESVTVTETSQTAETTAVTTVVTEVTVH